MYLGMYQRMYQTHEVAWGKIHHPLQQLIAGDVSGLRLVVASSEAIQVSVLTEPAANRYFIRVMILMRSLPFLVVAAAPKDSI